MYINSGPWYVLQIPYNLQNYKHHITVQEYAAPDNKTEKPVHVVELRVLHLVIQQSVFLVLNF